MDLARGSVWVDAQGTQSVDHSERGIGRYIGEQIAAVSAAAPGLIDAVHLDPDLPVPATLERLIGSGLLRRGKNRPAAGSRLPAIYHVTSPMELLTPLDELWPRWARSGEVRTVVTLFDLIPLIFREWYLDSFALSRATYFARLGLLRRADHALAISERTAQDAVEHLGIPEDRITVIDCGVSDRFSSLIGSEVEAASVLRRSFPRLRDEFLLYVGGDDPRKNLEGAIRGYALLSQSARRSHQLVIVCKLSSERIDEFTAFAEEVGVGAEDLLFTGYVSDAELAALYRSCAVFVFPSLYEGAGLPILEAMSCGAPVVASRTSSIPEILGDLEATFDPADPADMAACLEGVLGGPEELESLRARSRKRVALYTWERVATRTLEGYERALVTPRRLAPARRRKRLAVFTPWPPQWTGVARHSRRVVEELTAYADVDVIAPADGDGGELDRSLEPEVGLWTAADFDWVDGLRSYDRLLYVLGASQFHVHAFEALMRRPGVVLAHDVRLLALYAAIQERRIPWDPDFLEVKLREMYGDRISQWDRRRAWETRVYVEQDVFMTQEVQTHAEQIIVHSHYQRDVLRLESPSGAAPTNVAPLGVPEAPAHGGRRRQHAGPLLVTYGLVSVPAKRMPLLLEGFAELKTSRPDARLLVVGEVSALDREALMPIISGLRLGHSVEVLGRVTRSEYWEILREADLAVQLRAAINKGPSAAVFDCIAARVPVIVSNVGSLMELPPPAVLPVPDECSPRELAERIAGVLDDEELSAEIEAAQDRYASENSFARVAERYAELLAL
jgi:glycosyltransferase involved in cell wall biosynthesis